MASSIPDIASYNFTDTPFKQLMQKRVYKILIVCSNYDFYMLEEDGRIDELIFNEYVGLSLRYPPTFLHADTPTKAQYILEKESIDLVIVWLAAGSSAAFDLSREIRDIHPLVPIIALTHYSHELKERLNAADTSAIDMVFHWNGNADIFLAIIKSVEDRMNLDNDVGKIGVQTILLVEDSIRYYSSYLPNIYRVVLQQARSFVSEALNEHTQMMRMRGRPKIILATTYEEAIEFYEKHRKSLIGVISDISYPRNGVKDENAGFILAEKLKKENKYFPVLLQSSQKKNEIKAKVLKVGFMYKHSETLSVELRDFITKYFAFGDFEFKEPKTKEIVARASDLKSLQKTILKVDNLVLRYHIRRNHFSKWLRARALFTLADLFAQVQADDFESVEAARKFLLDSIAAYRRTKAKGVIANFKKERYDEYFTFSRIGDGALGGKGRGLAFIDSFLKRHRLERKFDGVNISIPRTVVLSTSVYDEFMEMHKLFQVVSQEMSDDDILDVMLSKRLPEGIYQDLKVFVTSLDAPIAVRSSSVLEDSHYQPFAGIFSTYMIPNRNEDIEGTMAMLTKAIKSVYASVFFKSSKSYVTATSHSVEEGKMAVILQEVVGSQYGDYYYPNVSGVARSMNFYPIGNEKPDEGIAHIAFGLGRITVGGGRALRVSPAHPKKVLQLSSPDMALRDTQKYFYALNMNPSTFTASTDDGVNITRLKIKDAPDTALKQVASTYDLQNHTIRPGVSFKKGKRIITFDNILKYNVFPLPEILKELLRVGQKEMSNPIEIEFAVNLSPNKGALKEFYFLQIRPIVENNSMADIVPEDLNEEETIVYSESALGNGRIKDVYDIVYVKPETFDAAHSRDIAIAVEEINKKFIEEDKKYILIGPGRWGSSDPWLGIPVKWIQISQAKVIIEAGLENYRIDPSQGTHFFQNLTSFKVGYFTINPYIKDGFYDIEYLKDREAFFEDDFVRHIRFEEPINVKIDGKNNRGVIYKIGKGLNNPPKSEEELVPPDGFC